MIAEGFHGSGKMPVKLGNSLAYALRHTTKTTNVLLGKE
jgi:RNA:NAD 2'-phosphotransferase (TPT1/KptA family)